MRFFFNILPVLVVAVALMELYRENTELKYNYESLAWQMDNKTGQLDEQTAMLFRRTYQGAQRTNYMIWSRQFQSAQGPVSPNTNQ